MSRRPPSTAVEQVLKNVVMSIPRKDLRGTVVSAKKMEKTVKVAVPRIEVNTKYRVRRTVYTYLTAHDEANKCDEGDVVGLRHSKTYSKTKHHVITEIIRKDPASEYLAANPQIREALAQRKALLREEASIAAQHREALRAERVRQQQQVGAERAKATPSISTPPIPSIPSNPEKSSESSSQPSWPSASSGRR